MRIAIEPALTNVKSYLVQQGYDVECMHEKNPANLQGFDAVVVTGMNENLLGVQDTETSAVVINADGLSAEEVAQRLGSIRH